MKRTIRRWMIAAAGLAAIAGSAAAQGQMYKAGIPMAFRVSEKLMQPGMYQIIVHRTGPTALFLVLNEETRESVALAGAPSGAVVKAWRTGAPVLAFECAAGGCALKEMWDGDSAFAYAFPAQRRLAGEVRLAVVALRPAKGD